MNLCCLYKCGEVLTSSPSRSTMRKKCDLSASTARVYRMKSTILTFGHNSPACSPTIDIPSVRVYSVVINFLIYFSAGSRSSPSCPPFFHGKCKARIGFRQLRVFAERKMHVSTGGAIGGGEIMRTPACVVRQRKN